ncbi:hypothetical protein PQU92_13360 [Asticcacaulis sp. BYS171W]|uniref:Uncharacterized protein n=1 Tax=Asticcacaulis aquaticus TaxID=2984212 RepID=A0ABT5HW06_9CAUL|nr:hypothetical protein [Asticcacaulis aquaticus]MDC7684272.1 hypothetical protein [Asticcacaulis aquaticus]
MLRNRDASVEQLLDALDFMRKDLRTHDLNGFADIIDKAFETCADRYVEDKMRGLYTSLETRQINTRPI